MLVNRQSQIHLDPILNTTTANSKIVQYKLFAVLPKIFLVPMIESGKNFDNNGRIRNKKVAVYRPSDGGFNIGTITKFLENSGEHRVEYDDGKAEELYLFLMDLKWEPEIVDEKTNETEAMKEEA